MARAASIDVFVRDALAAGRTKTEIAAALSDAGWRSHDVERALDLYADTGFVPPVPRPQPFVSARDAFLYGLTFVALVVVVTNLASAAFEGIEWILRPDERLRLSWDIAALVVFGPVFVLLDRRVRGDERDTPLRKMFAYGALFCASLVLLVDLVAAIALALSGGLGAEVALKSAVVGLIAALVLLYYRSDLRGDIAPRHPGVSR